MYSFTSIFSKHAASAFVLQTLLVANQSFLGSFCAIIHTNMRASSQLTPNLKPLSPRTSPSSPLTTSTHRKNTPQPFTLLFPCNSPFYFKCYTAPANILGAMRRSATLAAPGHSPGAVLSTTFHREIYSSERSARSSSSS